MPEAIGSAVVGSAVSGLFGGGGGGSSQTTMQLPSYIQQPMQRQIGRQEPYYNEPYYPYPGARIAPFSGDEMYGFGQGRQFAQSVNPNAAASLFGAGAGLNPEMIQQMMNPYKENVLNNISYYGNRNLTENVLPQVQRNFIGAGQSGSSVEGDITARALRDNQEQISRQQGQFLSDEYGNTLNRALQSGAAFANLFGQSQQGLFGQGQLQRGMGQSNLDLAYQDFQRQQGFPMQQGQSFIDLLSRAAGGQSSQNTTQTPNSGNPLSQMLGLGAVGYGLYDQGFFGGGGWQADQRAPVPSGAQFFNNLPWLN